MGDAGEGRTWIVERRLKDITATLPYEEGGKLSHLPTPRPACLIEPHKNGNLIELALRLPVVLGIQMNAFGLDPPPRWRASSVSALFTFARS
jgi:hypothetical protein